MELTYIIINAVLYVGLFLFLLRKRKSTIGIFLGLIWSISALSTIFFYINIYKDKQTNQITLFPFIYLFVLVIIFFLPAINIKEKKIQFISGNYYFLKAISILAILINILPFIENMIYAIIHIFERADTFGINYNNQEKMDFLSSISLVLYKYSTYLRIVIPFILFYFLQYSKNNKILIIGLIICVFNPIIGSLNSGSRFVMVTDILYFSIIYLFFKNTIDEKVRRRIIKVFSIGGILMLIIFVSITVFRFSDKGMGMYSIWGWLSLYTGESFLNFNADMWKITQYTDGDNSFFLIRYWLGEYPEPIRSFQFLGTKVPIRTNVFYTFIGDFYMDFGKYVTVVIIMLLSCFFYVKSKKCSTNTPIHILMLLGLYLKIACVGFTYFTYLNGAISVPYSLVIIFFVFLSSKGSKIRYN